MARYWSPLSIFLLARPTSAAKLVACFESALIRIHEHRRVLPPAASGPILVQVTGMA